MGVNLVNGKELTRRFLQRVADVKAGRAHSFSHDRSVHDDAFVLYLEDSRFGKQKITILVSQIDALTKHLEIVKRKYKNDALADELGGKENG